MKFIMEVYVDDYISLAIPRSKKNLNLIANTIIHGMHSMFPASTVDNEDHISEKEMKKKHAQ